MVAGVAPDGPADRAGIRQGDLLLTLDGRLLAEMAVFYRQLWSLGPAGIEIRLGLAREGVSVAVADIDREAAEEASKRIEAAGGRAIAVGCDATGSGCSTSTCTAS